MIIKNKEELEVLKEAGKKLHLLLDELEKMCKAGVSTKMLDDAAREIIKDLDATPSFLNYKPYGAKRPYPAAICTSVNDEVVHGIPNENPRVLQEGDIITLDAGLWFKGLCVDSARTVAVGKVDNKTLRLIKAAKEALNAQINAAFPGKTTGDIGYSSEKVIKSYGYFAPEILGGHGVGKEVHEEPFVPNYGQKGRGPKLREGEVLAFEPIVIEGTGEVCLASDGYTYKSKDGSLSAQFEHTIVVLEDGAKIIT